MTPTLVPGLALTAVGLHLTVSFARDLVLGEMSSRWPATRGYVTHAGGHQGTPLAAADSVAVVTYAYTVQGQEFVGRRLDYIGRGFRSDAGKVLRRYPYGAAVTVYYDPNQPSRAVLERGVAAGNYGRLLLAVLMLLAGLMVLL